MRSCPLCQLLVPDEMFRPKRRPCIDCLRKEGRERERTRRLRDGDRIREAERSRVRSPAAVQRQRERQRLDAAAKRRAAGVPPRVYGRDPQKLRARRERINERRRVPLEDRKRNRYTSDEERRAAKLAYRRKYRAGPGGEKERARHRERQKERRAADPLGTRQREREAAQAWRLANPEAAKRKGQRDSARRNALKRNADVRKVSERELRRLLIRQGGECAYCDHPEPTHLDHIIPLVRGGRHSIGNLAWSCEPCNKSKGGRLVVEFRHGRSYRRVSRGVPPSCGAG